MSLHAQTAGYDPDNIFAKILRGELPCEKVYEDSHCLAFMDIMPRADGHVLVIPKAPARNIIDIDPMALAAMMAGLQKVACAVHAGMAAEGITIQQFSEQAGGQVVFHLHFHVIPRWNGIPLRPHTGAMENRDILADYAVRIKAALAVMAG
jgi:histidine triad (HIT) family protein